MKICPKCKEVLKGAPGKTQQQYTSAQSKYVRKDYVKNQLRLICGCRPRQRLNDKHIDIVSEVYHQYLADRSIKTVSRLDTTRKYLDTAIRLFNKKIENPIRIRKRPYDAKFLFYSKFPSVTLDPKVTQAVLYHFTETVESSFYSDQSYQERRNFSNIDFLLVYLVFQVTAELQILGTEETCSELIKRIHWPKCVKQRQQLERNLRDITKLHNKINEEQWNLTLFLDQMMC